MGNPRFVLRAFEKVDCCRTARIISDIMTDGLVHVTRDSIAERWAQEYPRHAEMTGRRSIRSRMGEGLTILAIARVITRGDDGKVGVINLDYLAMSSRNLDIVQDDEGVAIRPGLWSRRPEAPDHLKPIQDMLAERLPA